MTDAPNSSEAARTDSGSSKKPKPEEMGRDVPGTGEAIEPEALHNVSNGAIKAGDRMWGPPGTPDPEK